MKKKSIVIGGGVAGIFSALYLARNGREVTLVEKNRSLGGLFQSEKYNNDLWFDFGFRILTLTGDPAIDALMSNDEILSQMNAFESIRSVSYFKGYLHENGGIDARLIGDLYERGLQEFRDGGDEGEVYNSLYAQLVDEYGITYTDEIFKPVLKKFIRSELSDLAQNAHQQFAFSFVDPESKDLQTQKNPRPANKATVQSSSPYRFFYPREGGIRTWIDLLDDALRKSGVKIIMGLSPVKTAKIGEVHAVHLENGTTLESEELIWSGPFVFLVKSRGLDHLYTTPSPQRCSVHCHHMVFNTPLLTDASNILCYDPSIKPWRVKAYQNIQEVKDGNYRITAEVICHMNEEDSTTPDEIRENLVRMGLLSQSASVRFHKKQTLTGALPILSHTFIKRAEEEEMILKEYLSDVIVPNPPDPRKFFSNLTLPSCYKMLLKHLEGN
jgi:protoporphyrinogen oxidase